jgi:uncharacterized membrane protein YedE/YeeE
MIDNLLEIIRQPWSWYAGGIFIGLTVPLLLFFGNKPLGISSSMRHACAACFPANILFFRYNWKEEAWNLVFVAGIGLGGFIASAFLSNPEPIQLNPKTVQELQALGVTRFDALLPVDIFHWEALFSLRGLSFIVLGGFLVGFGTRYAGGCTSGHTIMGLSNLQVPSLIATICFMIGGFLSAYFLVPFLLRL